MPRVQLACARAAAALQPAPRATSFFIAQICWRQRRAAFGGAGLSRIGALLEWALRDLRGSFLPVCAQPGPPSSARSPRPQPLISTHSAGVLQGFAASWRTHARGARMTRAALPTRAGRRGRSERRRRRMMGYGRTACGQDAELLPARRWKRSCWKVLVHWRGRSSSRAWRCSWTAKPRTSRAATAWWTIWGSPLEGCPRTALA